MKTIITWRKATKEEIEKKLDAPENPGMVKVSEQQVEAEEDVAQPTIQELKEKMEELESKVEEHEEKLKDDGGNK